MALWQYSFFVLPKTDVQYQFNCEEIEEGFCTVDDDKYWQAANVSCSDFSEVEHFLSKGNSWSEDLIVFGNIESTCLKVSCENGVVLSVTLRIDFTTEYESLLREIIEYFIRHGYILLDDQLHPVTLNFESVKQKIENSSQVSTYRRLKG